MTLIQTRKLGKRIPVVMLGKSFWDEVIDFEAMVRYGTIDSEDLDLFLKTDSVDVAYDYITEELEKRGLKEKPGGEL